MKWRLVLAISAAFAYSAFTGFAVAAEPCGRAVIDDWYDNGILDRDWDCECLHDAINRLPDIRPPYSSAQDDFQRQIDLKLCEGSSQQVLTATLAAPTGATDEEDSGHGWSFPVVVALAIAMTVAVVWWAVRRQQRKA